MNESLRADVEATTSGVNEATTHVFFPVTSEKVPYASFFFLEPTPSTRMEQAAVVLEFFFPATSNPPGSNQMELSDAPLEQQEKQQDVRPIIHGFGPLFANCFFIHG
jgi:hypothetical protein